MIVIPMHVREDLMRALDAAHDPLRGVDASDITAPPPPPVVDRVGNAVVMLEDVARRLGYILPEFRR